LSKINLGDFISLKWTCILTDLKNLSRGRGRKFSTFFKIKEGLAEHEALRLT
jgi:hypothetical protein